LVSSSGILRRLFCQWCDKVFSAIFAHLQPSIIVKLLLSFGDGVFFIIAWEIAGAAGLLGIDYTLPKAVMYATHCFQ
jgi:hypothetical protein